MSTQHCKHFLKFKFSAPTLLLLRFFSKILKVFSGKQEADGVFQPSATREVKLSLPRQYYTLEDLCWCISDYMGHSLLSYIEWSWLLHASPVSCASTYPCRAKIQSEIPHRALSSCLHRFWQNLHFSLAIWLYAICLPFRPLCPRFLFDWLLFS